MVLLVAALGPGATPAGAIVGGTVLRADDGVPAVALWLGDGRAPRAGRPDCSGVLVGPRSVLTAAHCLSDAFDVAVQPYELRVAVGGTDLRRVARDPAGRGRRVAVVARHPRAGLEHGPRAMDLALLRLVDPVVGQRPVRLASVTEAERLVRRRRTARLTGWGATRATGDTVLLRRAVVVRPAPWRQARRSRVVELSPRRALAVGRGGARPGAACFGDSGGPLLRRSRTLVGVVTGSVLAVRDCHRTPVLVTRIDRQGGWISSGGRASPALASPPEVPPRVSAGQQASCRIAVPSGIAVEAWWERASVSRGFAGRRPADARLAHSRPTDVPTARSRTTDAPTVRSRPRAADRGAPGRGAHPRADEDQTLRRDAEATPYEATIGTRVTRADGGWRLRCVVLLTDSQGRRSTARSIPVSVREG